MNAPDQVGLWTRLTENSIPVRIMSLSALLLGALIVSAFFMVVELAANQNRINNATERFHRLQSAATADRDFAALRYWMTDLSASLLTLSERNANAAHEQLTSDLEDLRKFAPVPAQKIQQAIEGYLTSAQNAVDAYTDGNRVLGNAHLAQARENSDSVSSSFDELIEGLVTDADQANRFVAEAAEASRRRTLIACVAIILLGAGLTALVLRSILRPLKRINNAMTLLNDGVEAVDLPAEGPDEFGRMARTLQTLSDSQAARRSLEVQAAERQRMIETAVETIPDGFALFDAQDCILLVNNRYKEMFSDSAQNLVVGTPLETLLRARIERGSTPLYGQSADAWIAERLDRHRDPKGMREEREISDRWVLVTKRKTLDGDTIAIYSDITDMKARQSEIEDAWQEAKSASEAKSRFLASMSHELRTPLNAIIGYSEILIEDAQDVGETSQVEDLHKIMSSGKNLLSLINDILDLSKVEAGKMEVFVESLDVPDLLVEVVDTIKPLLNTNKNELVLTVDPEVTTMETDKTKLRQNLFNLLSNATKFTHDGTIHLNVAKENDTIDFVVADTGIGMTEDQMDKLFNAFVQADESTTRNYGGTGLGLAIVSEFTALMGGKIKVESEPDQGSKFTMALPVSMLQKTERVAQEEPQTNDGVCILVVDDEAASRKYIAELVRAEGFNAVTAADVETGIALARQHRPAAVVLDIIMPGRDGWSMLREMKEDLALCHIPVILASVLGDREMGLAFGAFDYLTKPVDAQTLADRLHRVASHEGREALIVDDDPASRALFRRILVREGWEVREAVDGNQGLDLIMEKRPSLVVLDLMMPNLDGFETLRKLRKTETLVDLPVIIATSKDLDNAEFEWLKNNSGDVVQKGNNGKTELVAAIRRHAAHRIDMLKKGLNGDADTFDR